MEEYLLQGSLDFMINEGMYILTDDDKNKLYSFCLHHDLIPWWWAMKDKYKLIFNSDNLKETSLKEDIWALTFWSSQLDKNIGYFYQKVIDDIIICTFMENKINSFKWWINLYDDRNLIIPYDTYNINILFIRGYVECLQIILELSIKNNYNSFPDISSNSISHTIKNGYLSSLQWLWGKRKFLYFPNSYNYIEYANKRDYSDVLQWLYERRKELPFRYNNDIICSLINNKYSINIVSWWWNKRNELDLIIPPYSIKSISKEYINIIKNDIEIEINYISSNVNFNECNICLNDDNDMNGVKLSCGHSYHKQCINDWFLINNTCPLCNERHKINKIFKDPNWKPFYQNLLIKI